MRLKRWFALAALIALAGGCVTSVAPVRADPAKARRACIAVNEATPLAMGREDQVWCEKTMRGWYAETWYTRADPADQYEGEAQLKYFRAKTPRCKRAADAYHLTGKDRWFAFMRCLVIVRTR